MSGKVDEANVEVVCERFQRITEEVEVPRAFGPAKVVQLVVQVEPPLPVAREHLKRLEVVHAATSAADRPLTQVKLSVALGKRADQPLFEKLDDCPAISERYQQALVAEELHGCALLRVKVDDEHALVGASGGGQELGKEDSKRRLSRAAFCIENSDSLHEEPPGAE
jgi:hypothetical protein